MGATEPVLNGGGASPKPLTKAQKARLLAAKRERWNRRAAQSFLGFCQHPMWGDETPEEHHEHIISVLQDVADGHKKRVMIFAPPGSAKSSYSTHRFAAWYAGRFPMRSMICGTHTAQLSHRFGRKVRNTVGSRVFAEIFPGVGLASDSQAKGDWQIELNGVACGEYYAVGFDGAVAGRRCDLLLIDDPFKSIKEADSEVIRERVWDVYKTDLRSRMKGDKGSIIIIQTRWHPDDLSGRILPEDWSGKSGWVTSRDGEEWYVLRLAMECDDPESDPMGREMGETLWPNWWSPAYIALEKVIQGTRNWNALYQGVPTTEEGAILKASYWNKWPKSVPVPVCEYVIQTVDGAFEEDEEADYSARTTWGIFDIYQAENAKVVEALKGANLLPKMGGLRYHAILLEAWRGKVQFHTFKRQIADGIAEYEPNRVLIEKKASGHSLLQELRRANLPVKAVKVSTSKVARAHAAEPAFEAGCVWAVDKTWVAPLIRECAQFPNGENDDWVDCTTMAVDWLRRMFHLRLKNEDFDDDAFDDVKDETEKPIYG